jgi:hypothetical protein
MLGRVETGRVYRTGAGGIRVVERDGSARHIPAFTNVVFQQHPQRIEGRLYPVSHAGRLGYEAPALEPREVK